MHFSNRINKSIKNNNTLINLVKEPETLKYASYHCDYEPLNIPSTTTLKPIEIENLQEINAKNLANLIEITIELPKNVCWWTQPYVCRWQPWEQSQSFLTLAPELQYFNLHYDEIMAQKTNLLFSSNYRHQKSNTSIIAAVDTIKDFNLHAIPEELRLHYFIRKHILPRLTATYKFDCELIEEEEIRLNEEKRRNKLQLEYREEQLFEAKERARAKAEQKRQRWEEKIARMRARDSKVNRSGSPTSISSISSMSSSSSESVLELKTLEFNEFIQGTVAKELFLHLDKICPLKIRKVAIEHTKNETNDIEKYMLSDLMKQIDEFNISEMEYFKDPPSPSPSISSLNENETTQVKENKNNKNVKKVKQKIAAAAAALEMETMENVPKTTTKMELIPHHKGKWTTDGIYVQNYVQCENVKTITFRTTDLGKW